MVKQGIYKILYNYALTDTVYSMVLEGDTSALIAPGQFVNIKLDGKFLRRPISVCDYNDKTITLIYKVVGEGTAQMAKMKAGEEPRDACGGWMPRPTKDRKASVKMALGIENMDMMISCPKILGMMSLKMM